MAVVDLKVTVHERRMDNSVRSYRGFSAVVVVRDCYQIKEIIKAEALSELRPVLT